MKKEGSVAVLSLLYVFLLSVSAVGQSFSEARREFRNAFQTTDRGRQKKAIKTLGATGEKKAFQLIGRKMEQLARQLLNVETKYVLAKRKKEHGRAFNASDKEKSVINHYNSGNWKNVGSVIRAGGTTLARHAPDEWLVSFVREHGMRNPDVSSMLLIMKGRLLKPLVPMSSESSLDVLLNVFGNAQKLAEKNRQKKRRYDRKVYSIPQKTKWKNKEAGKLLLKRLPYTLKGSILDVLYRQTYQFLSNIEQQERVETLVEKGLSSKNWAVRAVSAYALGAQSDPFSGKGLVERLKKESNFKVRIELLKAIARRNRQSAEDLVQNFIKGTKMPVQYVAVHALSRIGTVKSVPVLIDRLDELDSGRIEREIIESLEYMTGKAFGHRIVQWRMWWKRNKDKGLKPPAKRDENLAKVKQKDKQDQADAGGDQTRAMFYDKPIVSNRVLFVVDASKSMQSDATYTGGDAGGQGNNDQGPQVPDLPDNPTKMEVAKYELMKSIKALRKNQLFNIIFFAGYETIWYRKSLLPGKPKVKAKAFRFIQNVEMRYATAIFDAMELGFMVGDVGGQPMTDEVVRTGPGKVGPDTIYLATDGQPYFGQYDLTKKNAPLFNDFYQKMNRMNQFRLMKIHGIQIGGDGSFLKSLVEETNYYPNGKKRPTWWIRPGTFKNVTK